MFTTLLALAVLQPTGTLKGRVTLAPLTRTERKAHHTHFDKSEGVTGYEVQVFKGRKQDIPFQEVPLDEKGDFQVKLPPGRYSLELFKDMNAGAFYVSPHKKVAIRSNHVMRVRLKLRMEYFD